MGKLSEKRKAITVVVVIVTTIFGLIWGLASMFDPRVSVQEIFLLEQGDRRFVTVILSRSKGTKRQTEWYELAVYELDTGEMIASREVSERARSARFRAFRRDGYFLWTFGDHGVQLVDLRSIEPRWTQAQLIEEIPILAEGFEIRADGTYNDYSPPTRGLPVTLRDGTKAWIDMSPALQFEAVPSDPWKPGYFCGPDGGARPSCERKECIAFQSSPGSTGMVLGTASLWNQSQIVQLDPSNTTEPDLADAEPFLRPSLVRLHETECAFELERTVFVLHDSAATEPKEPLLSRVDRNGQRQWTRSAAAMQEARDEDETVLEPFAARMMGGELVVVLRRPGRGGAISLDVARLDPESGEVLGQVSLVPP